VFKAIEMKIFNKAIRRHVESNIVLPPVLLLAYKICLKSNFVKFTNFIENTNNHNTESISLDVS
jgi:hypothetical protein